MTPIVLQSLRKEFGSTVAVDRVDLTIPSGALFFLLGPSGCGKTTLLRMIAGFSEPTAGRIFFGDKDVTRLPANRRNAGMVFQGYALWPHMTVSQNVGFGLQVRKVEARQRKQRIDEALELVQMTEYAQRKPNELSGGQQQRVALARALVIRPTVLLLDEPLSNLDAKLRLEMRSQIRGICRQTGITAVYVTHDQKEALSMADGIAVLNRGNVIQTGPPRELYDKPATRFVADFLGETNFIQATVGKTEDGRVHLDSPAGALVAGDTGRVPAKGSRVWLSIRPEAIRLEPVPPAEQLGGPSSNGTPNRIEVKATDSIYLGELAQHLVEAPGHIRFKIFELHPRPLAAESPCSMMFAPEDVIIVAD
ncbi:MAG: ABC transporter ATP-binding protein [Phycisphaeraceae bacterium]|nr:ABC transporter ATP-binding protein [Phycisphaeraceae bacterium]